jgi:formylglycine-generating enzyme required for sulfatase activity
MSWDQIQAFESATGLRLPTEAEWEYACRAGTQTRYSNGSNDPESVGAIAWFEGNSNASTRFVGQNAANPLGFHDMHGNVSEWCEDWYSSTYYDSSPAIDPRGGGGRNLQGASRWLMKRQCPRCGLVPPGRDQAHARRRADRSAPRADAVSHDHARTRVRGREAEALHTPARLVACRSRN